MTVVPKLVAARRRIEVRPFGKDGVTILVNDRVLENLNQEEAEALATLLKESYANP